MQQRSLQNSSLQNNAFQSATNLRSFTRSRSDNTFKGAKLGGVIRASSSPLTLSIQGSVNKKSDPVDIYKFMVQPGARYPSNTYTRTIKGKGLVVTSYLQHPVLTGNKIVPGQTMNLKGATSGSSSELVFNEFNEPLVMYLKFTPVGKKSVNYSTSTTYYPESNSTPDLFDDWDLDDGGFDDPWFDSF
jgi:hypothetical protein